MKGRIKAQEQMQTAALARGERAIIVHLVGYRVERDKVERLCVLLERSKGKFVQAKGAEELEVESKP